MIITNYLTSKVNFRILNVSIETGSGFVNLDVRSCMIFITVHELHNNIGHGGIQNVLHLIVNRKGKLLIFFFNGLLGGDRHTG